MKTVLTSLILFGLFGVSWIANLEREVAGEETRSVLEGSSLSPGTTFQDETQSVIETPGFGSDSAPAQVAPLPSVQQPFNGSEQLLVEDQLNFKPMVQQPFVQQPFVQQPFVQQPFVHQPYGPAFCATCRTRTCRCEPAPVVATVFCLTDPCGGQHETCIEVPACCAVEQPTVAWKGGLFGRQVATLCWSCCDHEVKVVIARNGKIRVRG